MRINQQKKDTNLIKIDFQDVKTQKTPLKRRVKPSNSESKLTQNTHATAKSLLPPIIASKLTQFSQAYGLNFDLGNLNFDSINPEEVKAYRTLVEIIQNKAELLPEILKLSKQVMKADLKMADAQSQLANAAMQHQVKLDEKTAEILLNFQKFEHKSKALASRLARIQKLREREFEARQEFYENSVLGDALERVDIKIEQRQLVQNQLQGQKVKTLKNKTQRKLDTNEQRQTYIDSALY
jgi:hypothetical protein